ncbi:MAG: flagellar basal body L-ring protein FlgH [Candidatus Eremiobacteraeota bacterium]|nr:flagellar basal body L-ring protein FlgH [Candidatus Eremiobacteraeota bacterium]
MLTTLIFAALAGPAWADTLYVAGPPPSAPGHPLHLSADKRAQQVGDLVAIQFNFNVASNSSTTTNTTKGYNLGVGAGVGNAAFSFLRFPTGLTAARTSSSANTQTGSNTFTASMMATVTDVLPSGALVVAGDQDMIVNGQHQTIHIVGTVRPEDIDTTDTVLSSRVANLSASFNGNFAEKNQGLLTRILNFLF